MREYSATNLKYCHPYSDAKIQEAHFLFTDDR
jgi:hypothetical protein